jgi:hypothetical protein
VFATHSTQKFLNEEGVNVDLFCIMITLRYVSRLSFLLAFMITLAPAGARADETSRAAPADEYFGMYRMSVLGIRNVIHDLSSKIERNGENPSRYLAMISLTENAIRDWERKYPGDSWLARSWFGLEHLYAKVNTDESNRKAFETAHWLIGHYPSSSEAKTMHEEIEASVGPSAAAGL